MRANLRQGYLRVENVSQIPIAYNALRLMQRTVRRGLKRPYGPRLISFVSKWCDRLEKLAVALWTRLLILLLSSCVSSGQNNLPSLEALQAPIRVDIPDWLLSCPATPELPASDDAASVADWVLKLIEVEGICRGRLDTIRGIIRDERQLVS